MECSYKTNAKYTKHENLRIGMVVMRSHEAECAIVHRYFLIHRVNKKSLSVRQCDEYGSVMNPASEILKLRISPESSKSLFAPGRWNVELVVE